MKDRNKKRSQLLSEIASVLVAALAVGAVGYIQIGKLGLLCALFPLSVFVYPIFASITKAHGSENTNNAVNDYKI